MLKITKNTEIVPLNTVHAVLYGEPFIGKTSTLFTCDNVIVLGFEDRAFRADNRKEIIRIEDWNDIRANVNDLHTLIKDYGVIGIDTGGSLINTVMQYVDKKFPTAYLDNRNYYGKINTEVKWFLQTIESLKKDIVVAVHEASSDGKKIPDLSPKVFQFIIAPADVVGYLFAKGNARHIDFNSTSEHYGKNSAKLPPQDIPDYNDEPLFFQNVINLTKKYFNDDKKASEKYQKAMTLIKLNIEKFTTPDEYNEFIDTQKKIDVKMIFEVFGKNVNTDLNSFLLDMAKTKNIEPKGKGKGFGYIILPEPETIQPLKPLSGEKTEFEKGFEKEYGGIVFDSIEEQIEFFTNARKTIEGLDIEENSKFELFDYIETQAAEINIVFKGGLFLEMGN